MESKLAEGSGDTVYFARLVTGNHACESEGCHDKAAYVIRLSRVKADRIMWCLDCFHDVQGLALRENRLRLVVKE